MHTNFMARSDWRNQLVLDAATDAGLPVLHQDGTKKPDQLAEEAIAASGIGVA